MRRWAWIWFAGAVAWLFDAMVSLRLHDAGRAQVALLVAIAFFAAGVFYRSAGRP